MIELIGVTKSFAGRRILDDVSMSLDRGDVAMICGPSGSGKTTLLRTLNRMEVIDAGDIRIADESLYARGQDLCAGLSCSERAISLLVNPALTRSPISRSRGVTRPGCGSAPAPGAMLPRATGMRLRQAASSGITDARTRLAVSGQSQAELARMAKLMRPSPASTECTRNVRCRAVDGAIRDSPTQVQGPRSSSAAWRMTPHTLSSERQ